jgi:NAD(P)-dependent dehydrogenase (short-subunit alcohol dehydrogenase family)
MSDMHGKTALVVGASRGLGRGVAEAFVAAGASVVAVSRDTGPLADLVAGNGDVRAEAADASDPITAGMLLDAHRPDVLALVAGAQPLLRPLHHHTWETFSANWNTDVRMAFHWLREALLLPLRPGSRIIVMSSGAALQGSPVSGGYAGAKATQRFIADYAAQESERAGLGIAVLSVLPRLTPATELGRPAVAAYAARAGVSEAEYVATMGEPVTPGIAGAAFVELATGEATKGAFLLTGGGLKPL